VLLGLVKTGRGDVALIVKRSSPSPRGWDGAARPSKKTVQDSLSTAVKTGSPTSSLLADGFPLPHEAGTELLGLAKRRFRIPSRE
jgi:hypothetical protein